MLNESWLLGLATVAYGVASSISLTRARSRLFQPSPLQFWTVAAAAGLHTAFLFARGREIGHCPITTLFDVLTFVSWSLAVSYLVVGPLFRVTLLGVLTAPVIFVTLALIQMLPMDRATEPGSLGYWVELHAALSVLAYGALGLAGMIGVIYLIQDDCLKRKRMMGWIRDLPPLSDLARVNRHLLLYGMSLLTLGLASGLKIEDASGHAKLLTFGGVWLVYGVLVSASFMRRVSERRIALLSLATYAFMISTFWGVNRVHMPQG